MKTLACQISSTLMQLLFSFYQDMNVEKTLIQTLASGHESWETLKTNIDKKQCFLVFLGLCIRDRSPCISSLIGLGLNREILRGTSYFVVLSICLFHVMANL